MAMIMLNALRAEDVEKIYQARERLEKELDDPKVFEERMRTDPTFATLYQFDKRVLYTTQR